MDCRNMAQLHEQGTKEHFTGAKHTAVIPTPALSSIYTKPRTNEMCVEHTNVRILKRVKPKRAQRVGSSSSMMNTLRPLSETTISDTDESTRRALVLNRGSEKVGMPRDLSLVIDKCSDLIGVGLGHSVCHSARHWTGTDINGVFMSGFAAGGGRPLPC
jgi:hypothetical protein